MIQLSHPYMTTGKTIALTRQTFVNKVISLLFNMLSRLVTAFLPRSKCLLISWLQSPSAVILEPPKIKFVSVSIVSPSICHEVIGPDAMIFVFWMLSFKPTFFFLFFNFYFYFILLYNTVLVLPYINMNLPQGYGDGGGRGVQDENWCFCTVVLEKTLESPLDCKEIKLVSPKGNQSWIFIGRTDAEAEAEAPILWPPDGKN